MLVHFIASTNQLSADLDTYQGIVSYIQKCGHKQVYDWLGDKKLLQNPSSLQQAHETAISKCDVLIAEASRNDFSLGFLVSQAVSQKKSILLLHAPDLSDTKLISSLVSPYIRQEPYNRDTLKLIIKSFLDENDIPAKDMRFNFFIDRQIYQYLRSTSLATGKTKAEILRELVLREIEKK